VDVQEHKKTYSFPSGKKTNLVVVLGFGRAEKQFKMSQVRMRDPQYNL
jgi:hypothetical protein